MRLWFAGIATICRIATVYEENQSHLVSKLGQPGHAIILGAGGGVAAAGAGPTGVMAADRVHLDEAARGAYLVWPYRFDGLSHNLGLQLSGNGLRLIPR